MCGAAEGIKVIMDNPRTCCGSKKDACTSGRGDEGVIDSVGDNISRLEVKNSSDQALSQGGFCGDRDQEVKLCAAAEGNGEVSKFENKCKDGCCDEGNRVEAVDACQDECCGDDTVCKEGKIEEDGCCSEIYEEATPNEEPDCKSDCCGPPVIENIESGCCGNDKGNRDVSSGGRCSFTSNAPTIQPACAKSNSKCCSKTNDPNIDDDLQSPDVPSCCSKSKPSDTKLKNSCRTVSPIGCMEAVSRYCSTTSPTIELSRKGCCSPNSTSIIAGVTSLARPCLKENDGCCDTKPSVPGGSCCPPENESPCITKSCCDDEKPFEPTKGCCSDRPRKKRSAQGPNRKSKFSESRAASLGMKEEAMCPCCVQSMLKLNLTVLAAVLSRVNEAQERFKRCCIAFADMCCATSKTKTGCCETACRDENGSSIPHLDYSGGTYVPNEVSYELKADKEGLDLDRKEDAADIGENIVLEVIGMDCPDCLSKVTQAVRILSGAETTNADGVRGLVSVKYDPRAIDPKAIQTFTTRASGFTINVLDAGSALDKSKALVLPLTFARMPPQSVLDDYETIGHQVPTKKWINLVGQNGSDQGGHVDIVLRLDASKPIRPRSVLESLAVYGATLRPQSTDQDSARIHRDLRNIAFRTLASLILTIPILVLVWSPRPLASPNLSHGIQLALATLIILVAWPVYSGSIRSVYYLHRADLGVLTAFSTLTSYLFSVVAFGFQVGGRDIGEPFFETVGLLITLIFAGRTLQAGTRKFGLKAVDNLGKLQPQLATLVAEDLEQAIDVRLLHYDDIIRIKTGEIVPTDGVIIKGHGTADESSLTGESVPVAKAPGSSLTAGTKLQEGQLDIAVTRLIPENSISSIVDAVSSSSTGSEYQDLADKMAGWLLPIAGVCCLAAFLGWMFVDRFKRGQSWGEAVISGVGYAIAIAAVSCPCALAIAVTLVTSVSMATTVQDGILSGSTQALLTAHAVKAIAFDKTGTLSQGVMTVQQASYDEDPLSVQLIHTITAASKHPVSETAKRYIESHHILSQETKGLEEIDIIPGKGIYASFFDFPIMAGSAEFTNTTHHPLVKEYLSLGMTILVITLGQQLIGLFGMKDQPREGVDKLINHLEGQGKQVSLVSGDNYSAVHSFAGAVGISHDNVHASQTPVSKGEVVQHLKETVSGRVAFVGDGINDTIALSTADISIATGSASNASSQIIILSSDVPKAINQILYTSRMTRWHVVASLTFCGIYFTAAILLASGVTGWRIPPAFAGLGELVSVLPVLLVGGHLVAFKAVKGWLEGRGRM